jgi:hypothetical protein
VATYVVIGRRYGMTAGAASGLLMGIACAFFWFGIEAFIGISEGAGEMKKNFTPLKTKVEQLLTEARLIIPGGQALFGFQFIAMLTAGFDKLPPASQLVHAAALCFTALNVIILMAPAALHRLSFGGEDAEAFLHLGSALLIAAPMLLALAVAAELYVVFDKVLVNSFLASIAGLAGWLVMTTFWYVIPLRLKTNRDCAPVRDERPERPGGNPAL